MHAEADNEPVDFVSHAVPDPPDKGDYVPVRSQPFTLRLGTPGDLHEVRRFVRGAAEWLQTAKHTDQWAIPWPDRASQRNRMRNDLLKGKTWLLWDHDVAIGTVTIDTDEPLTADDRPVWPSSENHEPVLYVRRVIVGRSHAGLGLGAALLDWAAHVADRDYGVQLIRVDVWTTNRALHAYYERQRFVRRRGRDSVELGGYPSQALFERHLNQAGSDWAQLLTET
jgi:GNAT superfamily N-acetyltransferase